MKTLGALAVGLGTLALAGCGDNADCDYSVPGRICTIAGHHYFEGDSGYSGDGGPALDAQMSLPMDITVAPNGELFIADWNAHRIRRLSADGIIHFVAGNGELGGNIDDPAVGAFNHPTSLLFDPTGTYLYIAAWHNSKIKIIDPTTGGIVDSCGDGKRAYLGDNTPALTASLDLPASIAWDPQGNLTILDQANQVIRMVDSAGIIHTRAGQCVIDAAVPNGPGACPTGVAPTPCPAPSGKFVCGDPAMFCSKACTPGYNGDDIPVASMRMAQVFGQAADPGGRITFDPQGNLYFADVTNHIIRKIDPEGIVHRVAGTPQQSGYSGDGGSALDAQLNHPIDLAFGSDGTLYFTDVFNHCIRKIAPDGIISTVAGQCGTHGYQGDSGPAADALLNRPYGIEFSPPNTLYIADMGNSVIRAMTLP